MDLSASVHRQLQRVLPFMYAPVYGFALPTTTPAAGATTNPTATTPQPTASQTPAAASTASAPPASTTASASSLVTATTAPPAAASSAASAVPLEWRLLEDYPDTPLTLAVIGGSKVSRKPLTYMP